MASIGRLTRLFAGINWSVQRTPGANFLTPDKHVVIPSAGLKVSLPWIPRPRAQRVPQEREVTSEEQGMIDDVTETINQQVTTESTSRLFAVVHIAGKQFKVTENDLVTISGYWPPNSGDKLKLEKVLLVGGTDFTLIGRPILNRELVSIDATVIDKSMSHTKIHFKMIKKHGSRRMHFRRYQYTILRINSININRAIDEKLEVEGLDRVY